MTDRQKYVVSFVDDFHFTATSPEDAAMSLIEFIAKHAYHLRIQVHTPLSSVIIEPQFIELDAYGNPILNGHPVERFGWND